MKQENTQGIYRVVLQYRGIVGKAQTHKVLTQKGCDIRMK